MPPTEISVFVVFLVSFATALCTGLGALPFLLVRNINRSWLGVGNSIAAGLMLGASIALVVEAAQLNLAGMFVGSLLGILLIVIADWLVPKSSETTGDSIIRFRDGSFRKMVLIMLVMTLHSFAEGIGVGVSFGGGESFGQLISAAIAVHNVPEGLAIALVMIPRGVGVLKAAGWGIFSSLPQPLMAVPAFLAVQSFQPLLPAGLGLAAGAMLLMVFRELIPEACENISVSYAGLVVIASLTAMLCFQFFW